MGIEVSVPAIRNLTLSPLAATGDTHLWPPQLCRKIAYQRPNAVPSPACWGRWRAAPDGVQPAASTESACATVADDCAAPATAWFPPASCVGAGRARTCARTVEKAAGRPSGIFLQKTPALRHHRSGTPIWLLLGRWSRWCRLPVPRRPARQARKNPNPGSLHAAPHPALRATFPNFAGEGRDSPLTPSPGTPWPGGPSPGRSRSAKRYRLCRRPSPRRP